MISILLTLKEKWKSNKVFLVIENHDLILAMVHYQLLEVIEIGKGIKLHPLERTPRGLHLQTREEKLKYDAKDNHPLHLCAP